MLLAEPQELTEFVEAAPRDGDRRDASLSQPFWFFIAAHLIVWTLVPTVAHFNLPADTVEMLFCGHEWQLGYAKHPPLPSWISEAAYVATNRSPWSLYLVAQVTVVLSFWGVWRLAREFVSPRLALLAVCVLDCCYFYTYSSTEYNNNVAMYPCWSLGILFLYWAVQRGENRYWVGAGVALGIGLLAKYTTAILILTMVGFLLLHPRTRRVWRTSGPYLMLATAVLVFSPHLYWAIVHSFPTIEYALQRIKGTNDPVGHVLYPLWFAADQVVEVLPIAVVILFLAGGRVRLRKVAGIRRFQRDFLLTMVLVPFLVQVAVSSIRNTHLRPSYGSQLWLYFGLLLLICFETRPTAYRWKLTSLGCAAFCTAFIVAMFCHDRAVPGIRQFDTRTRFSGQVLADEVQSLWNRRYSQPLEIVSGEWWLAGNVAAYSDRRPHVYPTCHPDKLELPASYCTWLADEDLNRRGAVILWDSLHEPDGLPDELRCRFHIAEVVDLPGVQFDTQSEPRSPRIHAAIVPPQEFSAPKRKGVYPQRISGYSPDRAAPRDECHSARAVDVCCRLPVEVKRLR